MTRRARSNGRAKDGCAGAIQSRRCAIYTRVSTDHGLEQDFNSLDAQREACAAYIKSQIGEGWTPVKAQYDDGGFSGGTMDRPALQLLLEAVRQNRIDVIVVYKVDRLTRSLADFAKLVELFDAHGVSFVSVTQSFNTTTSMGRLTLNVLLSFAQFEREVTGERIRDKIAASKRKGIWVGGVVPLGYRVEHKKLVVDEDEAKIVRLIFERYLALGSMPPLLAELRERDIRTRIRTLSGVRTIGGVFFTKGPLAHLLNNRTYLGEINHRGESYPGDHKPIIAREIFDAVQRRLSKNLVAGRKTRTPSHALLQGLLFDDRGNAMTPSFAVKSGMRYRYYVSRALTQGAKESAGSISRVNAPQIEQAVLDWIANAIAARSPAQTFENHGDKLSNIDPLRACLARVAISQAAIRLDLTDGGEELIGQRSFSIPWRRRPSRHRREVLLPQGHEDADRRPIRSETRATLLRAIANGRVWLEEIVSGRAVDFGAIATRENRSPRSVAMTISLAFLAPDIVQAAIDGRLPRGIGVRRLVELSPDWREQRQMLGLPASTIISSSD